MADISLDDPPPPAHGQPPLPPKHPVQDISRWVEKFSLMAAVITSRYPEKAPEMFAYQASIVRAEQNFDDRRWVSYDRCYRREALASKNLNWSMPNLRLYNEPFTGHARSIPRCTHCLQEDHPSSACPRNPARSWLLWQLDPFTGNQSCQGRQQSSERCRRFNEGKCRHSANSCHYSHKCLECYGPHPSYQCPRKTTSRNRSRSPSGQSGQGQSRRY